VVILIKILSKKKLQRILNQIANESFDLKDIESIFNYFGDDYFIEDGIFQKCSDGKPIDLNQSYSI
jgi:hypothetical protein